jgi:FdrA protein
MARLVEFFGKPVAVVNLGIPSFTEDLKKQGVPVQQVDWRPPAGGNPRLLALIDRIKKGSK